MVVEFVASLNYFEVFGVLTGFACVSLCIWQHVWTWPITIVSATLFAIVFLEARLYANMGLQGFFVVIAIYGWQQWLRGGVAGSGVQVSHVTWRVAGTLVVIVAVSTAVLALFLATYTDALTPFWDSLATVLSLAAQWMLAKKILENWLVWIVTDIILIGVYLLGDLYLTAGLYTAYLALATTGFVTWRRSLG